MIVQSPITKQECKLITNLDKLPEGAERDDYDRNEYFETYVSEGEKYYYKFKKKEIKSIWTQKKT